MIYPTVKIWHIANTKNVFINWIDTGRQGERGKVTILKIHLNNILIQYYYYRLLIRAQNDDDYEDISVTLRLKKNFAYVLRLLAKHYENGDIDKFTSDEVSKIICALAESSSSSTILGPSISDELEQHIQSLLKDEKT